MLVGNVLVLEDLEKPPAKADLAVHQVLFDDNVAEAVRARDADDGSGDDAPRLLDHRAGLARVVRVADVDRNPRPHRRYHRVVVEHAEARVGELAHLAVGHRGDALLHVGNDAGIYRVDRVDVGEVLVDVGAHGRCEDRARNVGAAARERRDLAVLRVAEEAGVDHDSLEVGERARERRVAVGIERRVAEVALQHHSSVLGARIPRLPSARRERDGDELRVVVLAGGLHEVLELRGTELRALREASLYVARNLAHDVLAELQLVRDGRVALDDGRELAVRVLARKRRVRERDEEVRHLRVALVALAGCGNHNDAPGRISQDYVDHLV